MKKKAENKPTSNSSNQKGYLKLKFLDQFAREWMISILVFSDLIGLLQSFVLSFLIYTRIVGESNEGMRTQLIPFMIIILTIYLIRDLYNPIGLSPIKEMRLVFESTSGAYLIFLVLEIWLVKKGEGSNIIFALSWVFAIFFVQLNRWLIRIISRKIGVWGAPAIIIGNGPMASEVKTYLSQNIRLGILPVGMIDGKKLLNQANDVFINNNRIGTAIIVTPEVNQQIQDYFTLNTKRIFKHIILISSLGWIASLGVKPIDLEGRLGFEIKNNLLRVWQRGLKRGMDLLIVIIGILFCFPVFVLITVAIRLDSPGRIIFKQIRLGRNGQQFTMWKFRTMYSNAEHILDDILNSNPTMKAEWETTQKLKDDPRITKVGKFLRKWSLDELPQLFNILIGQMSVIGPRPCFPKQSYFYGEKIKLYEEVRPGLTGMWQVSGRNQTKYSERVRLDEYYIRNWSLWLDIYIFLRTIGEVILQRGAY